MAGAIPVILSCDVNLSCLDRVDIMYRPVELTDLALPEFGLPTVQPTIPADLYRERLSRLVARARAEGDDVFVVYGDREHFPNLTYLTGYDPRFEESLLVIDLQRFGEQKPLLLVGNEGIGYANVSPIKDDLQFVALPEREPARSAA